MRRPASGRGIVRIGDRGWHPDGVTKANPARFRPGLQPSRRNISREADRLSANTLVSGGIEALFGHPARRAGQYPGNGIDRKLQASARRSRDLGTSGSVLNKSEDLPAPPQRYLVGGSSDDREFLVNIRFQELGRRTVRCLRSPPCGRRERYPTICQVSGRVRLRADRCSQAFVVGFT